MAMGRVGLERPERTYLVRIVVDVDRKPAEVVTVYRTTKMAKYWRRSMKVAYDPRTDTLTVILRDGVPVAESDEDKPGVILDYDESREPRVSGDPRCISAGDRRPQGRVSDHRLIRPDARDIPVSLAAERLRVARAFIDRFPPDTELLIVGASTVLGSEAVAARVTFQAHQEETLRYFAPVEHR